MTDQQPETGHRFLEGKSALFAILTTVAIAIGGLVEIVPMFTTAAGPQPMPGVHPYTPLEVAGRDIYVREGCYVCHSQMIRPTRAEILRYGEWTRAGEYAYDHPFQFGSRRIGPDLQRVGGKYPDAWHYEHMRNPRSTSPGSIMPTYGWLHEQTYDVADIQASMRALKRVGVPYTDAQIAGAPDAIHQQADSIVARLLVSNVKTPNDREILAVIAYLQRLGVDGRAAIARAAETDGVGSTAPAARQP